MRLVISTDKIFELITRLIYCLFSFPSTFSTRLLTNPFINTTQRYYIWKDCQSKAQSQLWTDPAGYYFCNIVVAHPNSQGKGVGRALFKKVFEAADREGKKCYLESSRDIPNTAIYEKLGFKKVMQMDCDDDGEVCELFCMIREPRSSAS